MALTPRPTGHPTDQREVLPLAPTLGGQAAAEILAELPRHDCPTEQQLSSITIGVHRSSRMNCLTG